MSNWSTDDLFRWWIVQQQSAVMVHLGKITHPMTGKVERDLETARLLIDLLGAMETKTKGNLSSDEERFLGGILTNLRLNFVQEAKRPDPPDTESAREAAVEGSGTPGEAPSGEVPSGEEGDAPSTAGVSDAADVPDAAGAAAAPDAAGPQP
jgi:hypothetical protein